MSTSRKIFINTIMIISLSIIFAHFFSLKDYVYVFLPDDISDYLQSPKSSRFLRLLTNASLNWLISIIIFYFFVIKSQIAEKLTSNWGFKLLAFSVFLIVFRFLSLYLTTFVRGGGLTFVLAYLLSYLNTPIKIMIVLGLAKCFLSLKKIKNSTAKTKKQPQSVWYFVILILGFSIFIKMLFEDGFLIINYVLGIKIKPPKTILESIGYLLFSLFIPAIISIVFILKSSFYNRFRVNYGIVMVAISSALFFIYSSGYITYIQKIFNNSFSEYSTGILMLKFISFLGLLFKFLLFFGIIKIFITLKPLSSSKQKKTSLKRKTSRQSVISQPPTALK